MPRPMRVEALPVQPPRFGASLLNALGSSVINDGRGARWTDGGITWTSEQCSDSGAEPIPCESGVADALEAATLPDAIEAEPFAVWAGDRCSPQGQNIADFTARARRQLAASESFQIARELWSGAIGDTEGFPQRELANTASDTLTNQPTAEVAALACVDSQVAVQGEGKRGMVHMTPQVFTHLLGHSVIFRDGGQWVTGLGNIVIADAGYDGSGPSGAAAGASQWIYGTSLLTVRLSDVWTVPGDLGEGDPAEQTRLLAQAIDRSVNTIEVFAWRAAVIQWDQCVHVAAEVDVAVCLPGGAS